MNQQRLAKASSLLQENLSVIFQKEQHQFFNQGLLTITHVKLSPEISMAKVYVSVYGTYVQAGKEEVIKKIQHYKGRIRKVLGERIGKKIRIIPDLIFVLDETDENVERIERLMDN